jgi:hypothetical protein
MTYYNGCVAIAEGETIGLGMVSGPPDLDNIKARALDKCNANYKNCDIVYSECSMAVRIQ